MAETHYRHAFFNHIAQTSDSPMGLEIEKAEGCSIVTTDGKVFVDMISGIAVSSLGHRHPAVIEAIKEQVDKHLHVMVYGEFIQKPQSCLAALLAGQLPENLQQIYFVNKIGRASCRERVMNQWLVEETNSDKNIERVDGYVYRGKRRSKRKK